MSTLPPWCEDGEARRAFVRERTLIEERSALKAAKREGRKEASIETALNLLRMTQLDNATISRATDLAEDEVRQLRTRGV